MLDLGGTYRARTAEETLEWVTPFLKDFEITRLADVTGLDSVGIYVYQAVRPHSKALSVSQGKGTSRNLAKISAMMESIETWHAENIRKPDLYGTYAELSLSYPLLKPTPQVVKSEKNSPDFLHMKIYWIKAIDLLNQGPIYVPYTFFNLDFSSRFPFSEIFSPTSNGLASGNTWDEAICHGLYEVIERDAIAKAFEKNFLNRAIDLSTIKSPHILEMIERLNQENIVLMLSDITSEFQIPSYMACILSSDSFRTAPKYNQGFGTHFSKEIAASRAITEAMQTRLAKISGARDDLTTQSYELSKSQEKTFYFLRRYLEKRGPKIDFGPSKKMPTTFKDCTIQILRQLKKEKAQVFYIDHTREEYKIPVVHVMAPNLLFPQYL